MCISLDIFFGKIFSSFLPNRMQELVTMMSGLSRWIVTRLPAIAWGVRISSPDVFHKLRELTPTNIGQPFLNKNSFRSPMFWFLFDLLFFMTWMNLIFEQSKTFSPEMSNKASIYSNYNYIYNIHINVKNIQVGVNSGFNGGVNCIYIHEWG